MAQLNYDKSKLIIHAADDEIAVKLALAVTEEMQKLLEEQEAEAAPTEGVETETPAEGETSTAETQPETEEKSQ